MRKKSLLVGVVGLLVSLGGCGGSDESESAKEPAERSTDTAKTLDASQDRRIEGAVSALDDTFVNERKLRENDAKFADENRPVVALIKEYRQTKDPAVASKIQALAPELQMFDPVDGRPTLDEKAAYAMLQEPSTSSCPATVGPRVRIILDALADAKAKTEVPSQAASASQVLDNLSGDLRGLESCSKLVAQVGAARRALP